MAQLVGCVVSAYYAAEWGMGNIVGNSLASTAVSVTLMIFVPNSLQCSVVPKERFAYLNSGYQAALSGDNPVMYIR